MKIVLTGGPSAGKTTIAEALVRAYWNQLVLVPEAASLLFRGGFPRAPSPEAVSHQQRAIYHVQRELEALSLLESEGRSMICDRGTLDGLAYWPGIEEEFFRQIGSSMEQEIARYDWVLHLDTAGSHAYQSSSIRKETHPEAQIINERVKKAWRMHPRRIIICNNRDFTMKINLALQLVGSILAGKSFAEVTELAS